MLFSQHIVLTSVCVSPDSVLWHIRVLFFCSGSSFCGSPTFLYRLVAFWVCEIYKLISVPLHKMWEFPGRYLKHFFLIYFLRPLNVVLYVPETLLIFSLFLGVGVCWYNFKFSNLFTKLLRCWAKLSQGLYFEAYRKKKKKPGSSMSEDETSKTT